MSVNEKMTAIADAIREKIGETDKLSLDDMAVDITKVYDAGKKSQYDEFWDAYQDNGNRTTYWYAFAGNCWSKNTFKPKYKIFPTTANRAMGMFYLFGTNMTEPLDYRTVADMIDLTQITQAELIFANSRINYIEVDLSNCTSLSGTFRGDYVDTYRTHITLKVSEKCTSFSNCFYEQSKLTHLFFMEGSVIGANLSLVPCPSLIYDSLMSVINALKDYSGTTTTKTLTLHADSKSKLSESDIAIATQKGWTIA